MGGLGLVSKEESNLRSQPLAMTSRAQRGRPKEFEDRGLPLFFSRGDRSDHPPPLLSVASSLLDILGSGFFFDGQRPPTHQSIHDQRETHACFVRHSRCQGGNP
eukprot:scaffold318320_cov23-Tisochrysis_lutea.AAC.1